MSIIECKINERMCRIQIVIIFTLLIIGLLALENNPHDNDWPGVWFPKIPNEISAEQFHSVDKAAQSNLVDDKDPSQMAERHSSSDESEEWNGPWFPAPPGQALRMLLAESTKQRITDNQNTQRDDFNSNCDDGMTNLIIDYDPGNITHHSRHMCLNERKLYAPSYDIPPRLLDYTIPPEYSALQKCMDQPIEYDDIIPTFGTHRKLWPAYGEYVYVPPQRWLHTLDHGGIVLLYHPCANLNQLDIVKLLIKKCLYRHVITSYDLLEPERPFALVAWGRSLEFSVVDQLVIVSFIRLYALQGPEKIFSDGQYNQTLIEKANIVSSADDDVLCQNL